MTRLVLDASVTLTWCYPQESAAYAYAVLDALGEGTAVVPSLWPFEIANSVLVGERRQRLASADVAHFFTLLDGLVVEVDSVGTSRAFSDALGLARAHSLSAYDAAYLELAMREGLPIATLDLSLRRAARSTGVHLFDSRGRTAGS